MKRVLTVLLVASLVQALAWVPASAQRRRRAPARSTTTPTPPRRADTASAQARQASALTGLYRLDEARSDPPRVVAERAASSLVFGDRQQVVEELTRRLTSPYQIAIQRRGESIEIASTRFPRIAFVADGSEQTERAASGQTVRTRAALDGDRLTVASVGRGDDEFRVHFDPLEGGRRLRVTRRIFSADLNRPVVIQSYYDKVAPVARWTIYGEQPPPRPAQTARNAPRTQTPTPRRQTPPDDARRQPPPVITRRAPPAPAPPGLPNIAPGTRFVATLDRDLSTEYAREGDPFTMTVSAPSEFAGATVEGRVTRVNAAGRVSGRSELSFAFERLRLRDGRTVPLSATVEGVRGEGGEDVRVDAETGGSVEEEDSQGRRTAERVAIGAAVGALIGALAGGGRGAVIGAAVGAGAGAGSVYVQGRDHLELPRGTEFTFVASARRTAAPFQ
ncbi:MAG TPA: YMGG-like glycine zipper-containing protein [Pyrinomonadaceae bacterium]|nr:YMGG-like glycine zipper-containing protein [Pyrinomonadaceae bacterium]